MKSLRLLFALACVSLFAASFSWADDKPATEQPKDKPACACCCCKAKAEGKTCSDHEKCCCPKDKCPKSDAGCQKQDQPKADAPKAN